MDTGGHATQRRVRACRYPLTVALLLTLSAAPAIALPQLKLVQERTASTGAMRVKVYVYTRAPLGAYTLKLSFDPALVEVTAVDGGVGEFGAAPVANPAEFSVGAVRFSAFQAARLNGPTGRVHIATVTVRPRGAGPPRFAVEALVLADTGGKTYRPLRRGSTLRLRVPSSGS